MASHHRRGTELRPPEPSPSTWAGSGRPTPRSSAAPRPAALASVAILAVLIAGCGGSGGDATTGAPSSGPSATATTPPATPATTAPAYPLTLTDDDGTSVTLDAAPERIVTWAPSNTEILFALGAGDRVVGVSGPFDDYPPEAAGITQVGGADGIQPNVETIVSLDADLVLNGFLGGDDWKASLRDAGIPVFSIYATDYDDAAADIRTVGRLTGDEPGAEAVAADLESAATEVSETVGGGAPVSCFLEVGYPDLYTVGPQDFPFDILERAGCAPVTAGADAPYPLWSVEQLVADDPEVYFVTTEAAADPSDVATRPGYGQLTAVTGDRVYVIDSALITRPGPRLADGLIELAGDLHPDLFP
jgi:iron complex transport system substrate-binding protein